ncbi:unnamed protein product [Miscanthus lutarioriparius]|uniref:DYW domain-containing protein n=1 Tax=Miscanthus lutarioriparius TaxID=422564 RepID=A0A811P0I0_9POAL|nr:unnamed protein product [Miscanthus lutarioriparius]
MSHRQLLMAVAHPPAARACIAAATDALGGRGRRADRAALHSRHGRTGTQRSDHQTSMDQSNSNLMPPLLRPRDPTTLLPSLAAASPHLRALHAHLLVSGRLASPSHLAAFLASLASSNHLPYARLVLPRRLQLFKRMESAGIQPNGVSFVAVLGGCSMAGLVDEGRACFDSMDKYGVDPWPEHYGCMVGLYGRAGRLDDAINIIKAMPMEPHEGVWGALLNASRIHNRVDLGKYALDKLLAIESENDAAHVLLSNIYAESQNWKGVCRVRGMMKAKGVKKVPGWSTIEVDGEVHEFFAGSKSHPRYNEIELMLAEMNRRLRLQGYTANTREVLFDIEEEEKEGAISLHSEKLALAFGLIALPEDVEIRIVKNLRVCRDCHDYTKLISKVFNREIVMRDRNRFHHFKGGECSCRDYR